MEGLPNFEQREKIIDEMISNLEKQEGMEPDFILWDLMHYAPYEGNDAVNPEYLKELSEKLGISVEEMNRYAVKKAKEYKELLS